MPEMPAGSPWSPGKERQGLLVFKSMEQTKTTVSDAPECENAYKQQWMQIHSCKCMTRQTFMGNSTISCPLYFDTRG